MGGRTADRDMGIGATNIVAQFKNEKWNQSGILNVARHGHRAILYKDRIMIVGGAGDNRLDQIKPLRVILSLYLEWSKFGIYHLRKIMQAKKFEVFQAMHTIQNYLSSILNSVNKIFVFHSHVHF